jgi:hypothetical protein
LQQTSNFESALIKLTSSLTAVSPDDMLHDHWDEAGDAEDAPKPAHQVYTYRKELLDPRWMDEILMSRRQAIEVIVNDKLKDALEEVWASRTLRATTHAHHRRRQGQIEGGPGHLIVKPSQDAKHLETIEFCRRVGRSNGSRLGITRGPTPLDMRGRVRSERRAAAHGGSGG